MRAAVVCAVAIVACVSLASVADAKQHRLQQQRLHARQARDGPPSPFTEQACSQTGPQPDLWARASNTFNGANGKLAADVLAVIKSPSTAWTAREQRGEYARVAQMESLIADFKAQNAAKPDRFAGFVWAHLETCVWQYHRSKLQLNFSALRKAVPVVTEGRKTGLPAPEAPWGENPSKKAEGDQLPVVRYDVHKTTAQRLMFNDEPVANRGAPWAAVKTLEHYAAINALPLVVYSGEGGEVYPAASFLPAQAGACTYTILAAGARVFATGPLTGGSVYVARNTEAVLMIHANAPAGAKFPQQLMDDCAERVLRFTTGLDRAPGPNGKPDGKSFGPFIKFLRFDKGLPKSTPGYNADNDTLFAATLLGIVPDGTLAKDVPRAMQFEVVAVVDPKDPNVAKNSKLMGQSSGPRRGVEWGSPIRGK